MLTPDDILQDRYRIVRRLSHGGMGAVYEAIDRRVKSTVAIKETFAMTEEGRRAFRHEAQRLANLEHEAFPKVFDHFEEGEGLYLVMQLVRGEDLAERLKERINYHEGPFSPVKVLEWADQLLDALELLHEYRPPIIHRDIKPSNLKLTQRGKIILLDFGIAKGVAGLMSATDGSIKAASPNFSPLEQILRIDETSVEILLAISQESVEKILQKGTDPRSDIYALGATLYCLMTGKLPADSRLRALAVWAGRQDPLQPASKLNAQVTDAASNVLMQAMALDPSERIADAATMRQRLREVVGAPAYIPPAIPLPEELEQRRGGEARRSTEAVTERERIEEEEPQQAEEEMTQRDAEAHQECEVQETTLFATEERQRREALERQHVEEEEQPQAEEKEDQEEDAQRLEVAGAERRQAEEERRRTEQERLTREAEEAERKRAAEPEEERTAEVQPAIALTQRASESRASDSLAVKTVEAPPPERVVLIDGESAPRVAPLHGRNNRAILIGMIALVALAVVVIVILTGYGESNNNQSSSSNSSADHTPLRKEQESGTAASNSDSAAAPSPEQPVTLPTGMAYVQGGEFTMGRDGDPSGNESPAHKVTVNSFYIDLYEVTREDYQKCVDEKKCQPPLAWGGNKFPDGTAKLPVTGVTWKQANAYASWAGKRLPSEEEWEFAARGGTREFLYPWGNEWQDGLANANSASGGLAEVGSYKGSSPFGVFDMVGNAWEWTVSPFKSYRNGKSTVAVGVAPNDLKVIRGCMYGCNKDQATTTYRRGWPAHGNYDYGNTGFRCAKDATK